MEVNKIGFPFLGAFNAKNVITILNTLVGHDFTHGRGHGLGQGFGQGPSESKGG